jgi:hypothetical protein
MSIAELYHYNCITPSDINQHLDTLKMYADKCDSYTEIGVRGCISLSAALVSKCPKVTAIDIMNVAVPESDKLIFICADSLKIEIEETDMLFIDSLHQKNQLEKELELHAGKVKKYLGFHDTFTFYESGDDGGLGLKYAIEPFLEKNENWKMVYKVEYNNGLTILAKIPE